MDGTHTQIWNECLRIFKDNVDAAVYDSVFSRIKPIAFKNDTLTLLLPSHFFYEILEENYIDLVRKTLRRVIGQNAKLEYKIHVNNSLAPKNKEKNSITFPGTLSSTPENKPVSVPTDNTPYNAFIIPGLKKIKIDSNLDKSLSFENFVVGDCNLLGVNAGKQIAQNPGTTIFNPLFIHGPSGVGKTHLAQAIGLLTKETHQDKIVLYLSSHQFQTEYTKAVKRKNVNDFINFYRNIDVLIIDDVQDFADKKGTQKVFFNIFNYLHQQKKQLILTADRPPAELKGFFDRLYTRFKWGVTAELEMPDFETRIKILQQKAYLSGLKLPDKVAELIAYSITTNIRELEGAMLSVIAHALAKGSKITVDLTKKVLKNLIKTQKTEFTVEQIIEIVGAFFNISAKAIKAKTRKSEVVQARQLAMYFAKQYTKMSLSSIGKVFNRDHTTVIHAIRTVKNMCETDKSYREFFEDLERKFKY